MMDKKSLSSRILALGLLSLVLPVWGEGYAGGTGAGVFGLRVDSPNGYLGVQVTDMTLSVSGGEQRWSKARLIFG
jgi:hypothetical protein